MSVCTLIILPVPELGLYLTFTGSDKNKFLNLQGTCIQGYLHLENIGIVCRIESKNKKATCPRCGLESDKLHQNHRHLVKDLPISGQPVYLQVNRRQFKGDRSFSSWD